MELTHPVPWFPAWGVKFQETVDDLDEFIKKFDEFREDNRWALLAHDVVASEVHLWTAWFALKRKEMRDEMIARTPDVEILRLISGTHQIKLGFQRAGIRKGDEMAWIIYLPDLIGATNFGEIKIPRSIYSSLDEDARKLSDYLGCTIIPKRPIPKLNGLRRIGVEGIENNINNSEIEYLFLSHMSLSEL